MKRLVLKLSLKGYKETVDVEVDATESLIGAIRSSTGKTIFADGKEVGFNLEVSSMSISGMTTEQQVEMMGTTHFPQEKPYCPNGTD